MKKLFLILTLLLPVGFAYAQTAQDDGNQAMEKYRRSSLYSVLIKHSAFPYAEQIDSAFMVMPMPDKFNDHNIGIRAFESSATKMKKGGKAKAEVNLKDAEAFLTENDIAKQLVAKWFDRNPANGGFDTDLIQERGFYDASQLDISNARESARGVSSLGDAGEELIGNTFVIVNDITFVDKGANSEKAAGVISLVGNIAARATGDATFKLAGDLAAVAANEIDGFRVDITTYLYRLNWNEEVAATFYQDYWINSDGKDDARKAAFENSDIFKVEYVGQTTTSASNFSSKSFSKRTKGDQMLTVCTRAVDKSIVQLQRKYDEFKVKVPVYKVSEDGQTVEVQIGMKEGINEKSQFEVLMAEEDAEGKLTYKRIGMIQPVKGQIWDNRYGALEEAQAAIEEEKEKAEQAAEANAEETEKPKKESKKSKKGADEDEEGDESASLEAASLTATTFKVLSGHNKITPGCLVREVTIKNTKKK